jgi:hypothetical protein
LLDLYARRFQPRAPARQQPNVGPPLGKSAHCCTPNTGRGPSDDHNLWCI